MPRTFHVGGKCSPLPAWVAVLRDSTPAPRFAEETLQRECLSCAGHRKVTEQDADPGRLALEPAGATAGPGALRGPHPESA